MTQCNCLNVRLSQLNKFKSAIKYETEIVSRLLSNIIGNPNYETNFPHKLLLTNTQVANLRKALADNLPVINKLSKTQLSKMIQSGGFLDRLLRPLLKTELPLIKNVIKSLAKRVLIPLRLTAAASAVDAGMHKKILRSGKSLLDVAKQTTLIISNDEMEQIMKRANILKIMIYY